MKIVVTVVGKDRVGIIARVSQILAEKSVNIVSINQSIVSGFFNMILLAEMPDNELRLKELQEIFAAEAKNLNLDIKVQNQDIFNVMHSI